MHKRKLRPEEGNEKQVKDHALFFRQSLPKIDEKQTECPCPKSDSPHISHNIMEIMMCELPNGVQRKMWR